MMKSSTILCASCFLAAALPPPAPAFCAELPTGGELLGRAIAHHDPQGVWGRAPLRLVFEESRPDEGARATEVTIDVAAAGFSWKSRRAGRELAGRLDNGGCTLSLDGSPEISTSERETHGLDCETLVRRRDYYAYLWGLPMKLRDPGTRIDETVTRAELAGREVLALRVTYDEAVGSDIWIFYFDPATSALAGYRFFHDEAANDGEYVILEGEALVAGLRLPRKRAWYTNRDGEHLGTDTLVGDRSDPAPPVAEAAPELAALAPFLGKTWRGLVDPERGLYDVARWELAVAGRAVRIRHSVDGGAYGGETIVTWDRKREELVFFYFTTAGFYTQGTMRVEESGRLITREEVSGHQGGIEEVGAIQEMLPDGRMRVRTRMLRQGAWEERGETIYEVDPAAEVVLPVAVGFAGG